jgi:hypothetical protein
VADATCAIEATSTACTGTHGAISTRGSQMRGMRLNVCGGIWASTITTWGRDVTSSKLLLPTHVQVPPQVLMVLVARLLGCSGHPLRGWWGGLMVSLRVRPLWIGALKEPWRSALTTFPWITHFVYERARTLLFTRDIYIIN